MSTYDAYVWPLSWAEITPHQSVAMAWSMATASMSIIGV